MSKTRVIIKITAQNKNKNKIKTKNKKKKKRKFSYPNFPPRSEGDGYERRLRANQGSRFSREIVRRWYLVSIDRLILDR